LCEAFQEVSPWRTITTSVNSPETSPSALEVDDIPRAAPGASFERIFGEAEGPGRTDAAAKLESGEGRAAARETREAVGGAVTPVSGGGRGQVVVVASGKDIYGRGDSCQPVAYLDGPSMWQNRDKREMGHYACQFWSTRAQHYHAHLRLFQRCSVPPARWSILTPAGTAPSL
jgi:hypothetical protein